MQGLVGNKEIYYRALHGDIGVLIPYSPLRTSKFGAYAGLGAYSRYTLWEGVRAVG